MNEFIIRLTLCIVLVATAGAQTADPRLERFLKKYPEADLNRDGRLTMEEATKYRSQMRGRRDRPKRGGPVARGERHTSEQLAKIFAAREFKGMPYRFFAPKTEDGIRYPLILSLHGAGGKGTDNLKNLKTWNGTIAEPEFQRRHPCFVVAPQSKHLWRVPGSVPDVNEAMIATFPEIWQRVAKGRKGFTAKVPDGKLGVVFELLDELAKQLPIDVDRVYVLGHSMGGFGSFEALAMQPKRFAAAIPSAGGLSPWLDPQVFKDVPVWVFHGDQDETVPIEMSRIVFERMRAIGGNMKLTTLGGVGHGASAFAFVYTGDEMHEGFSTAHSGARCDREAKVWEWLFAQRRGR